MRKIIAVFVVMLSCVLMGQEMASERLRVQEGLAGDDVTAVLQDHLGYIWVGTTQGLSRYDGYEVKIFRQELGNPQSLGSNRVLCLHQDLKQRLWVGTQQGGLNLYDASSNHFKHFGSDTITAIWESPQLPGELWVGTQGKGLRLFNIETEKFTLIDKSPLFITCFYESQASKGILWVGTHGSGLGKININSRAYRAANQGEKPLSSTIVTAILQDSAKRIWVGTHGKGLMQFSELTGKFFPFKTTQNHPHITTLHQSQPGYLWVGTGGGGLRRLEIKSKTDHPILEPGCDFITAITIDYSKILWMGTQGGGLCRLIPPPNKIATYGTHLKRVTALLQTPSGAILVGTGSQGLMQLQGGKLESLKPEVRIFSLCEHADQPQSLWVGTDQGLCLLNRQTGDTQWYRHQANQPNSLTHNTVTVIINSNQKGILWIGTYGGGVDRFDSRQQQFRHYKHQNNNASSISNNYTLSLCEDKLGNIWIGTYEGLNVLNPRSGQVTLFSREKEGKLSNNTITSIFEDRKGTIWVGTQMGLNRYNVTPKTFTHYTEENGLSDNAISSILQDATGHLWISTQEGLSCLQPDQVPGSISRFYQRDGLFGNHFISNAAALMSNGDLLFGGIQGFSIISPLNIQGQAPPPGIHIGPQNRYPQSIPPRQHQGENHPHQTLESD